MDIFLVEDSQSIRRLLVQRLESMSGARIVGEADRQDDAQALIQWLQPETVLLDLSLATGSGLQVLNGLRQKGYRGRVMVLTSQSADTYRDACIAAGADGFYDKASGLETLIGDLDVILDAPRSGAATAAAAPARMPRDTLTGLCDQRSLLERTDQASKMVARDHGEMAAYVLMLGNLDALRDSHGEAAVAAALRETAARLSQACSPADVLARHADAQFALVLTRVESAAEATLFGQQLQQLMQPGFEFQGQALAIQAQLGMALYPRDAISARALLTLAEARAYGAVAPTAATVFTH